MTKDELAAFVDSTAAAAQLGRLDLVSLLLAAIGVILVLGGVFAFMNFRAIARSQSKEAATKVAQEVAERVANEYLRRELPDVVKAYRDMMDGGGLSDDDTNRVAGAQDDRTGDQR